MGQWGKGVELLGLGARVAQSTRYLLYDSNIKYAVCANGQHERQSDCKLTRRKEKMKEKAIG